jgi:hypothetical protein
MSWNVKYVSAEFGACYFDTLHITLFGAFNQQAKQTTVVRLVLCNNARENRTPITLKGRSLPSSYGIGFRTVHWSGASNVFHYGAHARTHAGKHCTGF